MRGRVVAVTVLGMLSCQRFVPVDELRPDSGAAGARPIVNADAGPGRRDDAGSAPRDGDGGMPGGEDAGDHRDAGLERPDAAVCGDVCSLSAARCELSQPDRLEQCVRGDAGCLEWAPLECPNSTVCENGACTATACQIGFVRARDGGVNPANACEVCDLSRRADAWSPRDQGAECGPSSRCLSGRCERACLIDGVTVAAGARDSTLCGVCEPDASVSAYTALPDGSVCGAAGLCNAGFCAVACLFDGGLLAEGTKVNAGCATCDTSEGSGKFRPTSDGTPCGPHEFCVNRQCTSGNCFIDYGVVRGGPSPANSCLLCVPQVTPYVLQAVDAGTACGPFKAFFCGDGACVRGCFIDGGVIARHTVSSVDQCSWCDPVQSDRAWSPRFDLALEHDHCGACGHACGADQQCTSGVCCDAGTAYCGGSCRSLKNDPLNCGECGRSCLGAACAQGSCAPVVFATAPDAVVNLALEPDAVYASTLTRMLRFPRDGGPMATLFTAAADVLPQSPTKLIASGSSLYWLGSAGGVFRAPLDGGAAVQVASSAPYPNSSGLAVRGSMLYWTAGDGGVGAVFRKPLDGGAQAIVFSGQSPLTLAVDARSVYWVLKDDGFFHAGVPSLLRANLDGTGVGQIKGLVCSDAHSLVLDAERAYWACSPGPTGSLLASVDLLEPEPEVVIPVFTGAPLLLAVDSAFIYWSEPSPAALVRTSKHGGGAVEPLATGFSGVQNLSVDQRVLVWTTAGSPTIWVLAK